MFPFEYGSRSVIVGEMKYFLVLHLYGFSVVYPHTHWEGWVFVTLCVCVCVLCPGLFHMCLTLLWQGCPASQGRWRMSETRAEKRTASQHLDGMRNTLVGWLACVSTAWEQSKGWRPSKKPQMCVKYHSFPPFFICSSASPHVQTQNRPPKDNTHLGAVSHNTVLHPLTLSVSFMEYGMGQIFLLWHL